MIKFKNIAPIALVAILLCGCKEALNESELPKTTDKLIVLCGIAPGEPIEVILDVAKPILGKYDPGNGYDYSNSDTTRYLRSAQVMLTDLQTGQQVQLVFDTACHANRQTFIVPVGEQFDIVPGHEYRLNAEYRGCPPVSATTMVPAGDFSIANVILTPQDEDFQNPKAYAFIEVLNNTNEPASYSIISTSSHEDIHYGISNWLKDSLGNFITYLDTIIIEADTNIIVQNIIDYYTGIAKQDTIIQIIEADTIINVKHKTRDSYWYVTNTKSKYEYPIHVKKLNIQAEAGGYASGTMEIRIPSSGGSTNFENTNYRIINAIIIQVKHLNNDYVRYHSAWNSDDIFMLFSKPPAGYSNIDGGLGIFCAWMTKTFEITDFQIF
ncbi:MAG: DUF4249 family protein [Bacteroidales bacterium]|nr:DUF4249 family protein [Bacteroidales bacterium]